VALRFCGCAHSWELHHHPAGRCLVTLPAFEEEELPSWSCPCRGFLEEAPAGPWRWHGSTQTWAAIPSPRPTSGPASVTAPTGSPPAMPAEQPAA
jgi:hypothetical protein